MFDKVVMQAINTVARELQINPAALAAVAHIESGLRVHAIVNGKPEPLIRFEGHYFDRRLDGVTREKARRDGLSSPTAGAIANPRTQTGRWALLERAARVNRKAAYESTSWGIGQVMGAHWGWLGYYSVDKLVAEARSGTEGQLRLMANYIRMAGLAEALRRHDWEKFAHGYNGPAFRKNGYHLKLAKAHKKYASAAPTGPRTVLKFGDRGSDVAELQRALVRNGYAIQADGIYGRATEKAVRGFQRAASLIVDGMAGPATMAALRSAPLKEASSPLSWLSRLRRRLGWS